MDRQADSSIPPKTFLLWGYKDYAVQTSGKTMKSRASDIFQDCWARMTYGAKYDGSFSEMTRPVM